MVLMWLGIACAVVLVYVLLRKFAVPPGHFLNPRVRIQSVFYLGKQERLVFSEIDGQPVLLGVTPYHITVLPVGVSVLESS